MGVFGPMNAPKGHLLHSEAFPLQIVTLTFKSKQMSKRDEIGLPAVESFGRRKSREENPEMESSLKESGVTSVTDG